MYTHIKIQHVFHLALYLIYAVFCWLMLSIFLQYIPFNTDVAFLRIKQEEIQFTYYKIAFFIHVYTSILVLPAGFLQFSDRLRRNNRKLHRWYGWMYSLVILVFAAPSGFIMGWHANGGIVAQVAFVMLSILWFYFTWMAIRKAIKKDFEAHRRFVIRSFALTLSAITLRLWKVILVYLFHPHPIDVYQWVAWIGWGLNLCIAEFILFKTRKP